MPAAPINNLAQAFADPQVIHRGMRIDLPAAGAAGGTVPSVRSPMLLAGQALTAERAAPRLGEHTAAILGELDMPAGEMARLREAGIIG